MSLPRFNNTDVPYLGWWLCKNNASSAQGWTPEAYVEEQQQRAAAPPPPPPPAPAAARPIPTPQIVLPQANGAPKPAVKAKPTPPAPPAKRPVAGGRKPLAPPAPARDSAVSMNSTDSGGGGSGRATPNSIGNVSLAGGLAEALRARQNATQGRKDDDDDW